MTTTEKEFWTQTPENAEAFLKKWYFWATHSRLEPVKQAAYTVKRHWDGILRWFHSHINNGILEGINSLIQAAISLASNPLLSLPNTRKVFDALKALELYVVMEYYLTPSAALADYVFPASSTVEQPELWLTNSFCMACPQGIDPLYERRNSYDFYRGLGIRLEQEAHWPWETVEHGWWFPESEEKLPGLFRVFESSANLLCPDDPAPGSATRKPEAGPTPHCCAALKRKMWRDLRLN
ncbi:hypothetical protein JCM12294_26700 [Desulfocicer niacini]